MSIIADLSIFPLDKGASVGAYVGQAVKLIAESGLPYVTGPMGTSIEGPWPEVMAVVERCFEAMRQECDRVYLNIKIDYRRDEDGRLQRKVAKVQAALQEHGR